MRDNAASVFAADTAKNTGFSVHMYGVYDTAAEITSYVNAFKTANLPLVIGEFGYNHSDGNPDEDAIMATAVSEGIGYMGWSWSGNGGGVEYLDMVTGFNASQISSWGTRIISGANGLASTSVQASVYGGNLVTNTPVGPTATFTRTATRTNTPSGPTATRTRTPTAGPTFTRTNTPIVPTATATTSGTGSTCSPVSATIAAPFTKDGAGSFCWQSSNLGGYINSWNLTSLTINGVNLTNMWTASGSYPAKIGGYWYVSYNGPYAWSHFEAK